jgi:NADH dehydrogenase
LGCCGRTAVCGVAALTALRHRIVIAGGGFAGLECARALRGCNAEILVLDRHNHHCFQPLLYQVAASALTPQDIAWPLRWLLRNEANVRVLLCEVTGVDRAARLVITSAGIFPFDYLVVATGAAYSFFGHDEWRAHAKGVKTLQDATSIRERLLRAFETAEIDAEDGAQGEAVSVAIVGGGPTGVELAGALAEVTRETLARDFRRIDPRHTRIVLIEAGPRVLSAFPDPLSDYAASVLRNKGVTIMTNTAVTGIDARGVDTANERVDATLVVWAAGVEASPVARWLNEPSDRAGRVSVTETLTLPGAANIFVLGDCASVRDKDGKPVPGLAPAAKQMGAYAGRRIARLISGRAPGGAFQYRHSGDLATIGRNAAIARVAGVNLRGFIGWTFWSVAHVFFLIGARNRIAVAFNWLWDYVTFQRRARIILGDATTTEQDEERTAELSST